MDEYTTNIASLCVLSVILLLLFVSLGNAPLYHCTLLLVSYCTVVQYNFATSILPCHYNCVPHICSKNWLTISTLTTPPLPPKEEDDTFPITLSHFFHGTISFCSLRFPDSALGASLGYYCWSRNRKQTKHRSHVSSQDPAAVVHHPKRVSFGTPHPAICYCLLNGVALSVRLLPHSDPHFTDLLREVAYQPTAVPKSRRAYPS